MAENEGVPQAAEQAQSVEQQAPPAVAAGPWEQDIRSTFTDPQVAATVDAFLRSKIQPRMTTLEQQVAAAENAKALWDAFQEDPVAAYAEITRELYGQEHGQATLEYLQSRLQPAQTEPVAQAAQTEPVAQQPQLDPNTMLTPEELAEWRRERELQAYDQAVDQILGDPANADINRELYHTFVAAAEGDFQEAIQRYRAHVAQTLVLYGIDPATATAAQQAAAAAAPPVMGSEVAGAGAAPPAQPEYRGQEGLHKAIEDATAQMTRNREAPPVS